MPTHDPTIAELIRDRKTHFSAHCGNCRFIGEVPFENVLRGQMPWRVRMSDVVTKLVCSRCRNPPTQVVPNDRGVGRQHR